MTIGSDVAADSLCRLRVCDGSIVSVDSDSVETSLVVCGTSELVSDVECAALELTVLSPSAVFEAMPEPVSDTLVAECELETTVADDSRLRLVSDDVEASVVDGAALECSGTAVELDSFTVAAVLEIDALEVDSEAE